mmetsp:Transcript_27220/g.73559  ORF Transcript_27220/g.73559 Transcript_27220/m.73559 type:complete len:225 (+) Transcript_27220:138-812(+)
MLRRYPVPFSRLSRFVLELVKNVVVLTGACLRDVPLYLAKYIVIEALVEQVTQIVTAFDLSLHALNVIEVRNGILGGLVLFGEGDEREHRVDHRNHGLRLLFRLVLALVARIAVAGALSEIAILFLLFVLMMMLMFFGRPIGHAPVSMFLVLGQRHLPPQVMIGTRHGIEGFWPRPWPGPTPTPGCASASAAGGLLSRWFVSSTSVFQHESHLARGDHKSRVAC